MDRASHSNYLQKILSDAMQHAGRAQEAWETLTDDEDVLDHLPEVKEVYQRAQKLHSQARDLESSVLNVAITLEEQATEQRKSMKRKERATTPDAVEALQALQGFDFARPQYESEGPNLLAGLRELDSDSDYDREEATTNPLAEIPMTSYNPNYAVEEAQVVEEEEEVKVDGSEESNNDSLETKKCNCKKSRCLKLYCECFSSGIFCEAACMCRDCLNVVQYTTLVTETRQHIIDRSPNAFAPKVSGAGGHKKGCHCKKSRCLKKYCECYQANVPCTEACRCENCMNNGPEGPRDDSPQESLFDEGALPLTKRRLSQSQSQGKGSEGTANPSRFSQSQQQTSQCAPYIINAVYNAWHGVDPLHRQNPLAPAGGSFLTDILEKGPPSRTNGIHQKEQCHGNIGLAYLSLPEVSAQPCSELEVGYPATDDQEQPSSLSNKHSRKHPQLVPRPPGYFGSGKNHYRGLYSGHRQRIANLHAELEIPPAGEQETGSNSRKLPRMNSAPQQGNEETRKTRCHPHSRGLHRLCNRHDSSSHGELTSVGMNSSGMKRLHGTVYMGGSADASGLAGLASHLQSNCHKIYTHTSKVADTEAARNESCHTDQPWTGNQKLPAVLFGESPRDQRSTGMVDSESGAEITRDASHAGNDTVGRSPSRREEGSQSLMPRMSGALVNLSEQLQARQAAQQAIRPSSTPQFMRLSPALASGRVRGVSVQPMSQPSIHREVDQQRARTLVMGEPSRMQQFSLATVGSAALSSSHKPSQPASRSRTHSSNRTNSATRDDACSPPVLSKTVANASTASKLEPKRATSRLRTTQSSASLRQSSKPRAAANDQDQGDQAQEDSEGSPLRWGVVRRRKIIPHSKEEYELSLKEDALESAFQTKFAPSRQPSLQDENALKMTMPEQKLLNGCRKLARPLQEEGNYRVDFVPRTTRTSPELMPSGKENIGPLSEQLGSLGKRLVSLPHAEREAVGALLELDATCV